ncbi:MAG: choice-of-anchor tandem repeat GloVer-containing protein [Lentisphaerota bacterium]
MNNISKKIIVAASLMVLISAGGGLAAVGDFTPLYSMLGGANSGFWPMGTPMESGGKLFGTAQIGGVSNYGVVYSADVNGTRYTNLFAFGGFNGRYPTGKLLLNGGYFYGMTSRGGADDNGVIFRMTTNGSGYTVLHTFRATNVNEGAIPWGGLAMNSTNLFGMTYFGGVSNLGTIFRINLNGSGYANLHHFVGKAGDGKHPKGDLLLDGTTFYGMTSEGGSNNAGVVFSMALNGTQFKTVYEFTGKPDDAESPSGNLLRDGSYLYGMAFSGPNGAGVAFNVHTNGGTLNILKAFGGATAGRDPFGSFVKSGTRIYGMTRYGGANNAGVIFSLGGTYTNDYQWPSGGEPIGDPVMVGGTLYGSTLRGGTANKGTLFKLEANTNDTAAAWCAVTWIENQPLTTVTAGDYCGDRFWVRHSKGAGLPDQAYIGYGKSQSFDDKTWKWVPMTEWADMGTDYEFTGRVGRASAGNYYTAAKFIKGSHVYYAATINSWGDWNTQLYSPNQWTVNPLTAPANCSATAISSNQIDLSWTGDGSHWVIVFRKTTNDLSAPLDGTDYTQGYDYADQGACIYRGSASSFSDTGLTSGKTYYYKFCTENYSYYSTGVAVSATTTGGGGGGGGARMAFLPVVMAASPSTALQNQTLTDAKTTLPTPQETSTLQFKDDFNDLNADGWTVEPAGAQSWQVTATGCLDAVPGATGTYSYCMVDGLDVADKNITMEYDARFASGAVYGGLVYRGRVLNINPLVAGWADQNASYEPMDLDILPNTWHHIMLNVRTGTPYGLSDLYVDGEPVFRNEPMEFRDYPVNGIGLLGPYGAGCVEFDNVWITDQSTP